MKWPPIESLIASMGSGLCSFCSLAAFKICIVQTCREVLLENLKSQSRNQLPGNDTLSWSKAFLKL